jgi:hypothetical protein
MPYDDPLPTPPLHAHTPTHPNENSDEVESALGSNHKLVDITLSPQRGQKMNGKQNGAPKVSLVCVCIFVCVCVRIA